MSTWHRAAADADVTEDQPVAVKIEGKEIGLFRVEGKVYAIEDICPHAYALLSSGFVDGDTVECPLHQATFHIPTGKCTAAPADRDLATYPVKVDGDALYVQI
jgi:3-phenylpropionate/trans-cinnamate dioxygenase ferredoxin component